MAKILTLVADLFNEKELFYPAFRVMEEGYEVDFAGQDLKTYTGEEGGKQEAGITYKDVDVGDYEGLLVPGGFAPDKFRQDEDALDLVRKFHEEGKAIGFICHAGWLGISAGIFHGVKATSVGAIKDDMVNAGVNWVDEAPVVDGNIVTARYPADLPEYVPAFIDLLK